MLHLLHFGVNITFTFPFFPVQNKKAASSLLQGLTPLLLVEYFSEARVNSIAETNEN